MNSYLLKSIYTCCFILIASLSIAQNGILKGTVTDASSGLSVIGANVYATPSIGTISDVNGKYSLELAPGDYTVIFKYVSFKTQSKQITVSANSEIIMDIVLDEETKLLNQVVVSSSKYEKRLSEEIVSIEVITPEFVSNTNSTDISQALNRVPGVDIIDGQANIRGGSGYSYGAGSRVLLMVDDMPILQADAGFPNWSYMPIENMEQMEIIKGAASSLYGSAALNGIINIRTAEPGIEPETEVASFATIYQNPNGNVTNIALLNAIGTDSLGFDGDTVFAEKAWWKGRSPFDAGLSFAHRQKFGNLDLVTGGYFMSEEGWRQGEYDRRGRVNLNLKYRVKNLEGLAIGLNFNGQLGRSSNFFLWNGDGPDAYLPRGMDADLLTDNKSVRFNIDPILTYVNNIGDKIKLQTRYMQNSNDASNNQANSSKWYYGDLQYQKKLSTINLVTTAGVTANYLVSDSKLFGDTIHTGDNFAGYIQVDKKFFNKLNLTAGFRYEYNKLSTDVEAETEPVVRFGANYELTPATFLRASYGEGYRYPTIAEKFISTNVSGLTIFPNPELQSETGWSSEIGVKQGFEISKWKAFMDMSIFWSEYNDMTEFNFNVFDVTLPFDTFGFQSQNVGDIKITGFEWSVYGKGSILGYPTSLLAGFTYINPVFKEFDEPTSNKSSASYNILKYRNRMSTKLDVETDVNALSIGFALNHTSFMEAIDQVFNDPAVVPDIGKYRKENNKGNVVLDLRAAYNFSTKSKLALIVKNATNREYVVRPGIIEAPRNYTLKFSQNF